MIYSKYLNPGFFESQVDDLQYRRYSVMFYKNLEKYDVPNCEHPIFLRSQARFVPCGHCALCASRAKRDWIVRCNLELQVHGNVGEYMTLTFDKHQLLVDTSYRLVQLFLKRLRKDLEKVHKKITYFVAYENGEKSGRAHYHILIFGLSRLDITRKYTDPKAFNLFVAHRYWYSTYDGIQVSNGFVKSCPMTSGNIPYVTGYVQKKLTENMRPAGLTGREWSKINMHSLTDFEVSQVVKKPMRRQPFVKMSKGLGFQFLQNIKKLKVVVKKGFFRFGEVVYAIPRALMLKLEQLGLDWVIPDEYFGRLKYLEEFQQEKPRFSDIGFSARDVYYNPGDFYSLLFDYLDNKCGIHKQECLNILRT